MSASSRDAGCCGPAYACTTAQKASQGISSTSQTARQIPITKAESCSSITLPRESLQIPDHVCEVLFVMLEIRQSRLQSGD